jgi:osmotically-inducible protein OsmY
MRNRFWTIVVLLALVVMALGLIGFTGMGFSASDRPSGPKNEPLQTDAVIQPKIEQALRMDDRIDWELLQVEVK